MKTVSKIVVYTITLFSICLLMMSIGINIAVKSAIPHKESNGVYTIDFLGNVHEYYCE